MSLNDKIREYLLKNPHLMRSKYADTAKKFGTNYEQIRTVARNLRKKNPDIEPKKLISYLDKKATKNFLLRYTKYVEDVLKHKV